MIYNNIVEGIFSERPNRFIANVIINDKIHACHVKNTGRCEELLIKGARVYLQYIPSATRKTDYDLISVYKGDNLINMDSQVVNRVVYEYIESGYLLNNVKAIKTEYTYGKSRIDLMVEANDINALIEVKGVTLEENYVAMFPDAKTIRGVKHINELIRSINGGFTPYIAFVVQMMGCKYFTPHKERDVDFYNALLRAKENGVGIIALDCIVTSNSIVINKEIPVIL